MIPKLTTKNILIVIGLFYLFAPDAPKDAILGVISHRNIFGMDLSLGFMQPTLQLFGIAALLGAFFVD